MTLQLMDCLILHNMIVSHRLCNYACLMVVSKESKWFL
jgi:hypothetical protein